jgi:diguanylate cyclase (GGDEF)-like protein
MIVPRSYRHRLIVYIAVLLLFLTGVLVLVYRESTSLVLSEADTNLDRLVRQLAGQIRVEGADLGERARMIRDSTTFQEYMFIATSLGTGPAALREQYRRQFGWLQTDRSMIVARSERALIGGEHRGLAGAVVARGLARATNEGLFYHQAGEALEMVATTPIHYRSQQLGVVVLTKTLGAAWMATVRKITGGELLLVRNGRIVVSTVGNAMPGEAFPAGAEQITLAGGVYRVRRVTIDADPAAGELWFALSHAELTGRLVAQRDRMLLALVLGGLGVLAIGFMMLRNFSAPISRLAGMINEVAAGRFPEFPGVAARDEIGFLWNQFAGMVHSLREKQEQLAAAHQQLEKQAITDALTGLYNRRYLYEIYPKLWSDARRQAKSLSLIMIDLDHFKPINDRFGHLAGDRILAHVAGVLRDHCRVSDFIFRLGGEEFLVLTHGTVEGAQVLAEKIREALERSVIEEGGVALRVTASQGVTHAEDTDGVNGLRQALARADKAMYAAKQAGRNRVVVWETPRLVVSNP